MQVGYCNKMGAVCRACAGQRQVKLADGKWIECPACWGTGKAHPVKVPCRDKC